MRRRLGMPRPRMIHAAVGTAMLAVPATALALSGGPSAQAGSSSPLEAHISSSRVGYHRDVVVTGRAPARAAGQTVSLQELPADSPRWRSVASRPVRPGGVF